MKKRDIKKFMKDTNVLKPISLASRKKANYEFLSYADYSAIHTTISRQTTITDDTYVEIMAANIILNSIDNGESVDYEPMRATEVLNSLCRNKNNIKAKDKEDIHLEK